MKTKSYLTNGIALAAFGMLAVSCSHDVIDFTGEKLKQFNKNFNTMVMGNEEIDPAQNWSSAVNTKVNISVDLNYSETYKVYIFTANPAIDSDARYIGYAELTSGETTTINIARPADVNTFFVAAVDKNGKYSVQRFVAEGEELNFNIGNSQANARGGKRRVTATLHQGQWNQEQINISTNPNDYIKPGSYFINDMLNYTTWEGYYDLTKVDPQYYEKLCIGRYNEFGTGSTQPIYGDGDHFILPAGKSLSVDKINWNDGGGDDHILVVAGTLTINQTMRLDNGKSIVVAEGGKLILNGEKLEVTNTSRLMNYGTIEINGTYIDFTNGTPKGLYNGGTITGKDKAVMNFAGSYGKTTTYYNAGKMDLGDGAFQFNGTAEFINEGHIKAATGKKDAKTFTDLSASAQNGTVINLCDMTIDFYGVNRYIGCNNSLLHCSKGLMGNAGNLFVLGSQALVSVKDWYDNGGNIVASSDEEEYAVFKWTGTITEQSSGPFAAIGQVYFDGPKIEDLPNTYSNDGERRVAAILGYQHDHHYQGVDKPMEHFTNEATTDKIILKDKDGCNYLGFGDNDDEDGKGGGFEPNYIYYAFEDLGSTKDFDFNDVVIRVSTPVDGKADVELCATGGELSAYVTYDGARINSKEVHQLLGTADNWREGNAYSKMKEFVKIGEISGLTATSDLTVLPFGIEVVNVAGTATKVEASVENHGKAPLYIVANGNGNGKWYWPYEQTNIAEAYPQFGSWGTNVSENTDWYLNPAKKADGTTIDDRKVVVW